MIKLLVFDLTEILFGIKIVITGDEIPKSCLSIIIANHRTRLDWVFIWCLLARYNMLEHHKIVLKSDIKVIARPFTCY